MKIVKYIALFCICSHVAICATAPTNYLKGSELANTAILTGSEIITIGISNSASKTITVTNLLPALGGDTILARQAAVIDSTNSTRLSTQLALATTYATLAGLIDATNATKLATILNLAAQFSTQAGLIDATNATKLAIVLNLGAQFAAATNSTQLASQLALATTYATQAALQNSTNVGNLTNILSATFAAFPTNAGGDGQILSLTGNRTKWVPDQTGSGGSSYVTQQPLTNNIQSTNGTFYSDVTIGGNLTVNGTATINGGSETTGVGGIVVTNNAEVRGLIIGKIGTLTNAAGSAVAVLADLAAGTNATTLPSSQNATNAPNLATVLGLAGTYDTIAARQAATNAATLPSSQNATNGTGAIKAALLLGSVSATNTVFYGPTFYSTNLVLAAVDFGVQGNYCFTNISAAFTITGVLNSTNTLVNWKVYSISNSAATAQTFTWPTEFKLYGTNSGTSLSIPAGKVCKATISLDPQGTNFVAVCSNN